MLRDELLPAAVTAEAVVAAMTAVDVMTTVEVMTDVDMVRPVDLPDVIDLDRHVDDARLVDLMGHMTVVHFSARHDFADDATWRGRSHGWCAAFGCTLLGDDLLRCLTALWNWCAFLRGDGLRKRSLQLRLSCRACRRLVWSRYDLL